MRRGDEILTRKAELRRRVWDYMEQHGIARFPRPVHGRIPNFVGAEEAVRVLAGSPEWQKAQVVFCTPDSPQRPVRGLVLRQGKTLYMPVPRLASKRPFVRLRSEEVSGLRGVSSAESVIKHGKAVEIDKMDPIDLFVTGCVAVNRDGARVGKGGGYGDLELAIAYSSGAVTDRTPVATTVHDCQVLDVEIPMEPNDGPVDLIATPAQLLRTRGRFSKPQGIQWELLTDEQLNAIPALRSLLPTK